QETIRVVHEDCGAGSHVVDRAEVQSSGFDCCRSCRNPARTFDKEAAAVSVRESNWRDAGVGKLAEDRMRVDDVAQRLIGKTLLVIADLRRGIYAGEDRCLPGSALWSTRHTETRISRNNNAVEKCFRLFILKNRQW